MFKVFFGFTLCSAIFLWYCHEYHTEKFFQIVNNIPSSLVVNKLHLFLTSSSNFISPKIINTKIFTAEELKEYDGEENSKGIYLSILGNVYDVEKGKRHYGPGGSYHVFAGRDASRAFITGDFNDTDSVDHVLDLSFSELLSLRDWARFYQKEYDFKGKLAGRFYDESGKTTKYHEELESKFNEAEKNQKAEKDDEHLFPPCNVEWNAETGTKVWCSKKSGGINRDWIGVPRKLYKVGSESYRCACIDFSEVHKKDSQQHARRGHLQQYENCNPADHVCLIKE